MSYFHFKKIIRYSLKIFIQLYARLQGKAFYCNALLGNSPINISINSDMTVSCNCQDYDGTGKIGDFEVQSMQGIFDGPGANALRKTLSQGELPLLTCARCLDLRYIDKKDDSDSYIYNYSLPTKGLMVENTVCCNLNCLVCNRKSVMKCRTKVRLTLEDIKKISKYCKENSMESMAYYNLGESFLSDTIYDELHIFRNDNPDIDMYISTNGIYVNNDNKRDAALLLNTVTFSIDGITNEMVNKYQRQSDFTVAYNNMKDLVAYRNGQRKTRPHIEWKYVLFHWNDKKKYIVRAIEMARNAGVDSISFWPTMSPVYGISLRYYLIPFYRRLGVKSWKGREVFFTY